MRVDTFASTIAEQISNFMGDLPVRLRKPPKTPGTNYAIVYVLEAKPYAGSMGSVYDTIQFDLQVKIVSENSLRASKQAAEIATYLTNQHPGRRDFDAVEWVRTSPVLDVDNSELQEISIVMRYRMQALATQNTN